MATPISQTWLRFGQFTLWERSWHIVEDELRRRARTLPTKNTTWTTLELGWKVQARIIGNKAVAVFTHKDEPLVAAFRTFLIASGVGNELVIDLTD